MKGFSRKISLSAFVAAIPVGVFGASLVPYVNDFSQRTSAAIPSGRWMETEYKTGSLARRLAASEITTYSPYANEGEYQDGWAAKKIWGSASGKTGFSVVSDNGNQVVMANGMSGSYDTTDTAVIQPLGNEFKNGILKISVDIRTPPQTDSFVSSDRAYALCAPVFKSELDVTSSGVGMPLYFGPASLNHDGYKLRAVSRGRRSISSNDEFFGQNDAQNNITAGSWVRYEAFVDLSAGTYTAVFNDLDSGAVTDFRQWAGATAPKTMSFVTAMTGETGGIAGLAFLVRGLKESDTAVAPMFDNVSVSWKAPGSSAFVSVYENDFSVRRYRSVEPAGTTSGDYPLVQTTNVVNSVGYDSGFASNEYSGSPTDSSVLVSASSTDINGRDGWHRFAGKSAQYSVINPNKNGGKGWNNGAVLRATKEYSRGYIATPLGQRISSGKVRLYFDLRQGSKTRLSSNVSKGFALCLLGGNKVYSAAYNSLVDTDAKTSDNYTKEILSGKALCGAGYYRSSSSEVQNCYIVSCTGTSSFKADYKNDSGSTVEASRTYWHRYIVTADLGSKTFTFKVYKYGKIGQPADWDHTGSDKVAEGSNSFLSDAPDYIDSVIIATQGNGDYNTTATVDSVSEGKFPLFDNIRVCRVNDDGSDGLEIYRCDFGGSTRRTECEAASLAAGSGREGADRWVTRGSTHYAADVREFADGDQVMVVDRLNNVERYLVQSFGSVAKNLSTIDVVADIRPADAWANANGCAQVEMGGDDYYQGNRGWRLLPRVFFGFRESAGTKSVGLFKDIKFAAGTESVVKLSDMTVDSSHWYRFRTKVNLKDRKFSVSVYDQGIDKPLPGTENGTFVTAIADISAKVDSVTTLGVAAKGVVSRFGGGTDDPSVVMVDNLAVDIIPSGLHVILR